MFKGYRYIQDKVKAFLAPFGFKSYKASTYYRTTANDLLQFISFQKGVSALRGQMTINVVQKGLFAPGCSFDTLQPGNRIGQFVEAEKDKWWCCNNASELEQGAAEIMEILSNGVLPFFDFCKEEKSLHELVSSAKFDFLWSLPSTFVDKGYFYLKAGLYEEAIQLWEKHQPSKVPKYKTIKRLVVADQNFEIDNILAENTRIARTNLKI